MRSHLRSRLRRGALSTMVGWGVCITATASMGLGCDSAARAVFRDTATESIGEGVRTIVNGMLDGFIAAIQEAGDGNTDAGTTN